MANTRTLSRRTGGTVMDMTQGKPMGMILRFAIPLFIGNIFQQIYNMVDTMVVGYHLGDNAIAAIGATVSLYGLLFNMAIGMNSGYSIVVTQRFGAKDQENMKRAIAGTFLLNAIAAVVLTALSLVFLRPLMGFMKTPAGIFEMSYDYFVVICAGLTATVCYNMFAGILRAVGNSKAPLVFLIIASLLNVVLDVVFVMGLNMGIAGAAWATVISQGFSGVLSGIYLLRNYRDILPGKQHFRVAGKLLADLLSTGLAMALMLCVVDVGTIVFQRANNSLGEVYITAYTSARRLINLMFQPVFSLSTATSTFVGQNWGARKLDRIRKTLNKIYATGIAWAVFSAVVMYILGPTLIRLTTGTEDPAVIENAYLSLRTHFTMFPVLVIVLCLRSAMQAMGRKVAPVVSSAVEMVMKLLYAEYLVPAVGFIGICITEPTIWVAMAVSLLIAYAWQSRKIFTEKTA